MRRSRFADAHTPPQGRTAWGQSSTSSPPTQISSLSSETPPLCGRRGWTTPQRTLPLPTSSKPTLSTTCSHSLCTLTLFLTFEPRELRGVLVTLNELGHVTCSYLGTDPTVFSAGPLTAREPNYEVSITSSLYDYMYMLYINFQILDPETVGVSY